MLSGKKLKSQYMGKYTDNEYIEGILKHDGQVIKRVYGECFPMISRMVLQYGGDTEKAKDVFQDTLILIYRKAQAGEIKLVCKFSTYFYGISKKLWMQEIKTRKPVAYPHDKPPDIAEEPDYVHQYRNSVKETLLKHFQDLSCDCKKILRMHFNKATIDEIQAIMGYTSRHHTIDRKYRCKRSLIRRIMNDPSFKKVKNDYTK